MRSRVPGIVVQGYRVASRPSKDYPYGTLERQIPIFKTAGFDLQKYYPATINISISPLIFEIVNPSITFHKVNWTDLHPPEDFSFSICRLHYRMNIYDGYVYYPHPETKRRHFENASILEIITVYIDEIKYGDNVEIELNPEEVLVLKSG